MPRGLSAAFPLTAGLLSFLLPPKGLWNDPEEYYTEGNFLVLDVQPPPDMVDGKAVTSAAAGGAPPAAHEKLIRWQARARRGLSLFSLV